MDVWTRVVALCVVFVIVLHKSSAIKCWVCQSDLDSHCGDPFDNTTLPLHDCAMERLDHLPGVKATMCRKIRQKVDGNWRIIRNCAFLGSPGEGTGDEKHCTTGTGNDSVQEETCTCNSKDGCNAAPTEKSPLAVTLLCTVFALLML